MYIVLVNSTEERFSSKLVTYSMSPKPSPFKSFFLNSFRIPLWIIQVIVKRLVQSTVQVMDY